MSIAIIVLIIGSLITIGAAIGCVIASWRRDESAALACVAIGAIGAALVLVALA